MDKSKLAQHAYEEGHRFIWDTARILEIESNSRYRKYPYGALNESYKPTQFASLSHLHPLFQR
jgi:hypothetical protein